MASGRGAALLAVGIFAILFAFVYRPLCFDIPEFSMTCIGSWLPVMIPLIVLGGAAIAFGARSLLKAYGVNWRGTNLVALAAVAFVATIVVAGVVTMAWSPRHRAGIVIFDPAEDEIPPDYDAIVLQGWIWGEMLEINLLLEGEVQADIHYIVNVVVRSAGSSENPHIYRLTYFAGIEEDYGIRASQDQNSILLHFPFSLLAPDDYVVGLEAVIPGPDVWDFVNEMPREDLELARVLDLPFDAALLIPAVLGLAALGSWWLFKAILQRKT